MWIRCEISPYKRHFDIEIPKIDTIKHKFIVDTIMVSIEEIASTYMVEIKCRNIGYVFMLTYPILQPSVIFPAHKVIPSFPSVDCFVICILT